MGNAGLKKKNRSSLQLNNFVSGNNSIRKSSLTGEKTKEIALLGHKSTTHNEK